jgi:hypothetical protein
MNLNFYSKATLTLGSLRKSFVFCLVAAILFVNNSQAQSASALHFDGSNDNVIVPVKPALNVVNALTIEAWIKPSKTSGVQDVISKSSASASNGYIFPRTTAGWATIEFLVNINAAGWKTLKVPYGTDKIGQWHHVAATYDGFTMRIFIDGAQAGFFNFAGTITVNNNSLVFGNQPGLSEYYGGTVDDARIYNRALSACEIVGGMNCELAGTENGLIAYYKFNQGLLGLPNPLEVTLRDASPTGADGTLTNFGLLGTGLVSNWSNGNSAISSTVCPAVVPTTVTAGSLLALVPVSGTINLTAVSVPGATYSWTGPNNFTSNQQNPSIEGAGINASGTYTVTATVNGCAGSASTVITVAPRASGLNFDGLDDVITTDFNSLINSDAISVEAWIFPTTSSTTNQNLVSNFDVYNNAGFVFPKTNDKWTSFSFGLSVDHELKELTANFPTSALNKWNHVAATYDGYFMRIYLNGILVGTQEVTGTYTKSDKSLIIGNNAERSEYFKGTADEIRVWNRAVSQCEIINNMKTCELNGDNDGLANQVALGVYYRLNQGLINVNNAAYANAADSSGHNINGTLQNFALTGSTSNWVDGKVYGICDYFPLPMLAASANGSVFQTGSTAKLFAVYGNNDVYNWTGPNSFATTTQNPVLNNVQEIQSGTYTVSTPYVNCEVTASTRIKVSDVPQIIAAGPTSFCPSGSVSLSTAGVGTYQWFKNEVAISGATANTYTATATGNYTVTVTNGTQVTVSAPLAVTVVPDVTAPVADVATLPTINVTAPATVTTVPTATDNCRGAVNATTTSPLTFTHSGTYTIVWNYNDGNGNTSVQNQTVEVARAADVTAPVLTVPANITVAADGTTCNAVVTFAATATEESEDPTVTFTYSQNPGTTFPIGTTTVTVTATDAAGNSSNGSFTVTVTASVVAPITGTTTVCAGSNTTLATATTGGTWSSANAAVATVNAGGVVTGVSAGTTNIIYTNSCGVTTSAAVTVNALPGAPTVVAVDNCGSTVLTASNTTGTILWNTGATGSSITVTNAGNYTATQTVNGCTSAAGSATAAPKAMPATPVVTVVNNCGTSTLTVSNAAGTLAWSNGSTATSITVSNNATYTVTQTVNGCVSAAGSGVSAPKATPSAPTVTVADNCGTSTLTASNTTGSVLWSNGAATASITVSNNAAYTVTQTVNGCTSVPAQGTAAPKAAPTAPTVAVVNNCGTSTLTASNTTGAILWSNGATTASITVSNNATYTVTQTVNGCVSASAQGTAAPKATPSAPTVTVADNCGTSTLTASNTTGAILWSNGATTASITVSNGAAFTVTQTVNGCVSAPAQGTAAPKAAPSAPTVAVVNNCGTSTLTASNTTGSILWSNGATTASITVSNAASYTVTQTVNGCVSAAGTGVSAPKAIPATPVITVTNSCGSTTLTSNVSGSWSNGSTGSSITVTTGGSYTVTATNAAGCSASTTSVVTVNTNPAVSAITGNTSVVAGTTTQLSNTTSGGVWSSNSANATVNASGVVTGVTAGSATITYTVTSGAGCSTAVTTVVTVTPAAPTCTAPVFTSATAGVNVNSCNNAAAAYVVTVSGTTPALTYTFSGATTAQGAGTGTGATFNVGVTTVTVRAQNNCGTASQSFTVTVKSTTAPVPTVATLPTITGQCAAGLSNPTVNNSTCNDDCRCCRTVCHCRTSSCKCRDFSNTLRGLISYLLSFYSNNQDDDHDCDSDNTSTNGGSTASNAPTARDYCTGATIVGTTTDALTYSAQGTYTIHWKFVDTKGNTTIQDQTVIINDTQAPTPNSSTLATVSGSCSVTVTGRPTATDNCAGTITGTTTDPLTYSAQGTYTIRWTFNDGNGNTSTQNQTVVINDVTAPVAQVSSLPSISGSCGLTITSAPKANDNCAGVIVGTTTDPLTYSAKGTYSIRWTYNDGNGNTSTQTQTVNITGGPVASIASVNGGSDFCNELVLTGSSSVSGASYKWVGTNNAVVGTSQQLSLDQSSTEGTYQLFVTSNGCTSAAAAYTYSKQNLLSSYTILASNTAVIGKYNKVASGSIGITTSWGSVSFKGSTAVNGANSFVKALYISKTSSDVITKTVNGVASVSGVPAMQYNTSNANGYSNYSTAQYSTVTLSGNYKTLTIRKGTYATLSGTIFGTIDMEEGASVRFTNATINIDKLLVEDGARDGYYSYVRFAPNSSVRVSTQVSIGSQVLVNPDNYKVTFFMGDNRCDDERFTVKGADTKVIANIIMPDGKLFVTSTDSDDDNHGNCSHGAHSANNCPHKNHNHKACDHKTHNNSDCNDDVYMTGTFVVESVESKGNTVIWNSYQCGSASVPVTVVNKTTTPAVGTITTQSIMSEGGVTTKATTEEDLKITVMPNPSTTYFTLKFESKYETPINMRVMDANGRVVDAQTKIGSNSTIKVGANYSSGTYYAEMIQGGTRKVIQLIKVRG